MESPAAAFRVPPQAAVALHLLADASATTAARVVVGGLGRVAAGVAALTAVAPLPTALRDRAALLAGIWQGASALHVFERADGARFVLLVRPGATAAELGAPAMFVLPRLAAFVGEAREIMTRGYTTAPPVFDARIWLALAHAVHAEKHVRDALVDLVVESGVPARAVSSTNVLSLKRFLAASAATADEALAREWAVVLANLMFCVPAVREALTTRTGAGAGVGDGGPDYETVGVGGRVYNVARSAAWAPALGGVPPSLAAIVAEARVEIVDDAQPASAGAQDMISIESESDADSDIDNDDSDSDFDDNADDALPPHAIEQPATPPQPPQPQPEAPSPQTPAVMAPPAVAPGAPRRRLFADETPLGAPTMPDQVPPLSEAQMRALSEMPELRELAAKLKLGGVDVCTVARIYAVALLAQHGDFERQFRARVPTPLHRLMPKVAELRGNGASVAAPRLFAHVGHGTLPASCRALFADFVGAIAPHMPLAERRALEDDSGEQLRRYSVLYDGAGLDAWCAQYGEPRPAVRRALEGYKRRNPTIRDSVTSVMLHLAPAPVAPGVVAVTF